jgi:hypothetical protein
LPTSGGVFVMPTFASHVAQRRIAARSIVPARPAESRNAGWTASSCCSVVFGSIERSPEPSRRARIAVPRGSVGAVAATR